MVNVRRRRQPARTSAASVRSPVPAPHATAPAPRQGGPATVATRASATVAPTQRRRSTGSSVKRIPVERAALAPVFDDVLVGSSSPPFPSMNLAMLCQTTMTRTNWWASKTTTPPPEHAELPVDDQANDSTARTVLSPHIETDGDDDDDDASSTALGLTADGSDATTASTTALDHSVDGSDAPPASTTALGLPADESDLSEEGDVTDAGSDGNEVGPAGDGATATPSIPPMQQSTLFPIFRRGIARIGQLPATTAPVRNETSVSAGVGGGMGTTARADRPPAARNASESGDTAAPMRVCRLRSLVPQRVPQPAQGGRCWANPRPLCLQQRPRTLKHDRAACRPWPLVWVRAPLPVN